MHLQLIRPVRLNAHKHITQEIPPEKKCEKNCLFSREFRDRPVQVGAKRSLMPIFKPKMHVRLAFFA